MQKLAFNAEILSERSGLRETGFLIIRRAQVRLALGAARAPKARPKVLSHNPRSAWKIPNPFADGGDLSDPLVSGNNRITNEVGGAGSIQNLHVGPADTGLKNLDENLLALCLRDWYVIQQRRAGFLDDQCPHRKTSSTSYACKSNLTLSALEERYGLMGLLQHALVLGTPYLIGTKLRRTRVEVRN
jgi:hypothetical protein